MKYLGIIIYSISILLGMFSIGINCIIFFLNKNTLNKFCLIILTSVELIMIPLFLIFYSSVFHINNSIIIYISRVVLQTGLILIFIILPIYYFYILKISFKKHMVVFILLDIMYIIISFIMLYLYLYRESYEFLLSNFEFLILIISNFIPLFLSLITFLNLKRIINKQIKFNFLIINIIQIISIPICITEILFFKTFYSVALFFILYNIFFIFPILIIINKHQLNEENYLSGLLKDNYGITERENEIIFLLKNGLSYNEIADKLFISFKTVETHIYNIYKKTGVKNRLQLFGLLNQKSNN